MPGFLQYHQAMTPGSTLTKRTQVALRREELSRLVSKGVRRPSELAERLGVSTRTVRRDLEEVQRAASERGADLIADIQNRERLVSFERLEDAVQQLQPMIDNPRTRIQALRLLKELEERRSKLLGLDMPTKHAATDPTGQREYTGMTDELRRTILEEKHRRWLEEANEDAVVDALPLD